MAGRIRIPPYKPLGVSTQAVPGGGYLAIDAIAGQFGPSPMLQFGLQAAEGAAGVATVLSEHLAGDNEAIVKGADARLGETEQALLFDPTSGYLNLQGQDALTQAPAVIDAYREAQAREMATMSDDDQRQMLHDLSERRLASFSTQVERHSAAERIRWYDEAGERRIAQMQADARLHWSDDAMLRRALGTTRAEVREQAERHGWDSALTEATLRRQTSRTLVAAIEAAVERDPERARSLHTRYEQHIEASDRAALDALLAEAQTREHTRQASAAILNATPPDGESSVPQWRLRQAEAIADPAVRAATIRTLHSAAAADAAHARTLADQVLARVLQDDLTDPTQIPIRDWVKLDADHRQAIETRLDHNARGTEPAPNPALVDELATEMTEAPHAFVRRDLVPAVAHLPLPQWRRFRDWQAGIRRNDPTTEDQLYAIKRGLQLAAKLLPTDTSDSVTNYRAMLVEEIDTSRRVNGTSPDDGAIRDMVERSLPPASIYSIRFPFDPQSNPPLHPARLPVPRRMEQQAIELLQLLWLLLRGITIGLKKDQETWPPGRSHMPVPPPPVDGWPSERMTSVPNVPEVDSRAEPSDRRDMLPADLVEELKKPETFPQAVPAQPPEGYTPVPPPLPLPGLVPPELPPWREGYSPPEFRPPMIYEYEKWQYHPDGRPFTNEEYEEFQRGRLPYVKNPAHRDGHEVLKKYQREDEVRKTPIPPDAEQVYEENSVRADKNTWIGRNEHGVYYKYQDDNTGNVHFQGYLTRAQIQ
ncbi:MAG: hypothetical protein KF889_27935 [Alphaproteobacteria bacterium]|nr:hypothetical protein [Alphaproteobacteria bacterium]MCW5743787.1 hypothetical protein [Alphaproteobacteria bacterium]